VTRHLSGLTFAAPIPRPSYLKLSTPKGSKAAGVRYEKSVVAALKSRFPLLLHGQWFSFADAFGPGICQPDIILRGSQACVVLECKLTDRAEALEQIQLYLPIVTKAFGLPCRGMIIAKNLTRTTPLGVVVGSLTDAFGLLTSQPNTVPILHWLGSGPI